LVSNKLFCTLSLPFKGSSYILDELSFIKYNLILAAAGSEIKMRHKMSAHVYSSVVPFDSQQYEDETAFGAEIGAENVPSFDASLAAESQVSTQAITDDAVSFHDTTGFKSSGVASAFVIGSFYGT
jgi:hypothetical protein